MGSIGQFTDEIPWTGSEKKAARRAFDRAFERQCASIVTEARRMMRAGPTEIWRVHSYLSGQRKIVDRIYDYRYSVSRRALEAIALEGYRDQTLTLFQVSEMLGLSRIETEDFLGRHQVPLAVIGETDLDREAALFEAASRRNPR
jgi:hypothetical protein